MQRCSFRGCWDDGSDSIRLLNPNTGSPDHAIYACFKHANEARRAGIVWHDGPGHPNLIDNHRVARRQLVEDAFKPAATTKGKGKKMATGNWKINPNVKKGYCRIFGCRGRSENRGLCVSHYDQAEAAGELGTWALPEAKLNQDRPTGAEAVAVAAARLGMDEGAELRARIAALEQEIADRDEALAGQKERAKNACNSLESTQRQMIEIVGKLSKAEDALQIHEARARKLDAENQELSEENVRVLKALNQEKLAFKETAEVLEGIVLDLPGETVLERIRYAAHYARLPRPKALTRDDLERRCAQLHECDRIREGLTQALPLVFAGLELPADLAREILGTHADRLEQLALALD